MRKIEEFYHDMGLVNILDICPSIKLDIRYATTNNFTGEILYEDCNGAFCVPELAYALSDAQLELKQLHPDYSLVIFDAARPINIQKKMYDIVKGTNKECYVANPYGEYAGGFHNYGMAVDLSIVNSKGELLTMGTDYDSFEDTAHVGNEEQLLEKGLLTQEEYSNRLFLYQLMKNHNLFPYPYEWWHYQYHQKEEDKLKFKLLDY
jgi:D-alanyl-D-alanine dipeptidase